MSRCIYDKVNLISRVLLLISIVSLQHVSFAQTLGIEGGKPSASSSLNAKYQTANVFLYPNIFEKNKNELVFNDMFADVGVNYAHQVATIDGDHTSSPALDASGCTAPVVSGSATSALCFGSSSGTISISASGASSFTYSWVGPYSFSSSMPNITGLAAGSYSCTVTVPGGCATTVSYTVSQPSAVSAVASSNAPFCPRSTMMLYGTASGGVGGYTYSWAGPDGFTSTMQNPVHGGLSYSGIGSYLLTVTDANGCVSTNTTFVSLLSAPVVNLGVDRNLCIGHTDTLDAGNPGCSYLWNTSGIGRYLPISLPGTYAVNVSNAYGCTASDTIVIGSTSPVVPSVTISASDSAICQGNSVSFTASTVNGGSYPSYQWKRNGVLMGTTSTPTFTTSALLPGDTVKCLMASSLGCITASSVAAPVIAMSVTPSPATSIDILKDADNVCSGTVVELTANIVNGGIGRQIMWYKDGALVDTGIHYHYTTMVGSIIEAKMVSSLACANPDTASNTLSITINPSVNPHISILAAVDTVSTYGQHVNIFSDASYGGSAPIYQWYLNGDVVAGASGVMYNVSVTQPDTIFCVLTSNATCATKAKDTSNSVYIYYGTLDVKSMKTPADVLIYPVPNDGNFFVKNNGEININDNVFVNLYNAVGALVYSQAWGSNPELHEVNPSVKLVAGIYTLSILNDKGNKINKLIHIQ